ncbi:hypothetical protein L596_008962 [Steinernema carpocapsae]|uniref:glucuronosyltransferase n=1 Tax=Steinernema carpocapsae TaxID=34508 RepID=A0A4U5PF48_STECR|nr:hypothetical protein L596_008962 [Steinernema carpocapsae]
MISLRTTLFLTSSKPRNTTSRSPNSTNSAIGDGSTPSGSKRRSSFRPLLSRISSRIFLVSLCLRATSQVGKSSLYFKLFIFRCVRLVSERSQVHLLPESPESLPWSHDRDDLPKVMVDINEKLQKKFGSDFPTVKSIVQNTSVGLMNAVDMLDISKPISNKIINVGGIAIKKPKATLTPKIEAIFKKANKGVVLFSFGSIADTRKMKLFMKKAFVNAFAQFPDYEFIWKFTPLDANESHWVDSYDNIHRVNWMDQTTILGKSWPFNFYLNS